MKGHIFRNPGRKVWTLVYYGPRPDGTRGRIKESSHETDEKKARAVLSDKLRAVANDADGIADFEGPGARRVTVATLLDDLLAHLRMNTKGAAQEGYRLGDGSRLREAFGHLQANQVTAAKVTKYRLDHRSAFENATLNRDTDALERAFTLAVEEGRLVRCPRFPARLPEKNVRQGFFEAGELKRLLPYLAEPDAEMARFSNRTGWRRGELFGLRWEWVDLKRREIRLPDSKNDEGRLLPLDDDLAALMERRWKARAFEGSKGPALSDFVFHKAGRPMNRTTFGKRWRVACVKAGLGRYVKDEDSVVRYKGKMFHDFRRTAARNLTAAGVTEQVAMKITGHKTPSMFRRYNIVATGDVLAALNRERDSERAASSSNVVSMKRRKR